MKNLLTTKQVAEIMQISSKTILKYAKKYLPEKKIENGKTTFWTVKEVGDLIEKTKQIAKVSQNTLQTEVVPKTQLMTTKELATILNVDKVTIARTVEKLGAELHQVQKNRQGGYLFTEEQATLIKLKLRERNNLKDNSAVSQIGNDLEFFALIKKREEEQKILDAYRDRRIAELQTEKENLQIQLDESKEWYSVKRIQKLNPDVLIDWRMLKKESERLGFETKKVFDQNYGEVNAYHKDVYESLYFDTLDF